MIHFRSSIIVEIKNINFQKKKIPPHFDHPINESKVKFKEYKGELIFVDTKRSSSSRQKPCLFCYQLVISLHLQICQRPQVPKLWKHLFHGGPHHPRTRAHGLVQLSQPKNKYDFSRCIYLTKKTQKNNTQITMTSWAQIPLPEPW